MIQAHALQCGTVGTDETIPDRSKSKNPFAYTGILRGKSHRVWLPVFAYLIQHPKGTILVDTGWHTDVRTDAKKHLSRQLYIASKPVLPEGQAVTEQLELLGYAPKDIDMVVLTHLDVDHASGIQMMKDAKKFYASKEELLAAEEGDIRYNKRLWEGVPIEPYPEERSDLYPNEIGWDVFGDQTVRLVNLAGHSKGNTGVWIQSEKGFVIITGDACYIRENWEEGKLPGITANKEKAERSIAWIGSRSKREDCLEILTAHNPEEQPHVITL